MAERHIILFDGQCGFCRRAVARVTSRDRKGMFIAIPYQDAPWPPMTSDLSAACARAVHVVRSDGGVLRGGRAVLFILEHTGLGSLARLLAHPPSVWVVELAYRAVARNRAFFSRFF